jgi:hypothetical protein
VLASVLATAEISKTPFYIAGGALALWAVVLAGIGLSRPDFPYSKRGQRTVILLSFVMIAITIGSAVTTN